MSASITRRGFLKAAGFIAAGAALLRGSSAQRTTAYPELPPDSAYERIKRIRVEYILAAGHPQRRYALNRELMALVFEMREAGASRKLIMTMGQKSLYHAQRQVAALRGCAPLV